MVSKLLSLMAASLFYSHLWSESKFHFQGSFWKLLRQLRDSLTFVKKKKVRFKLKIKIFLFGLKWTFFCIQLIIFQKSYLFWLMFIRLWLGWWGGVHLGILGWCGHFFINLVVDTKKCLKSRHKFTPEHKIITTTIDINAI